MPPLQLHMALVGMKICLLGWGLHTPSSCRRRMAPGPSTKHEQNICGYDGPKLREGFVALILVLIVISVMEIQWTVGTGKGFNSQLASGT